MNDFPALALEVVTERHARICRERGHATHTVDGELDPFCPRCGEEIPADRKVTESDTLTGGDPLAGDSTHEGAPVSTVTIFCREGACNIENHTRDNCPNRAAAVAGRTCLNCQGSGQRSWPQSRNTDPRNPLVRERLTPQITKCYACNGTGQVSA